MFLKKQNIERDTPQTTLALPERDIPRSCLGGQHYPSRK
jgi:hypothetical protein